MENVTVPNKRKEVVENLETLIIKICEGVFGSNISIIMDIIKKI